MIRKLLSHKLLINFILSKPNKLKINLRKHLSANFSYKCNYTHQPSFYFSNMSNKGLEKSAIEEITQFYNVYGWSEEFIQQTLKNLVKYQQLQDWQSLITVIQFHLQKTKQNVGIAHMQFVIRLSEGIYYAYVAGKNQKAQQWVNIFYDILIKHPQLSRDPYNNSHYQYQVAQLLGKVNNRQQAHKWLKLFKNKFQNFDQTEQITNDQRFFTYLQLTEYSGYENKIQQGVMYSKKTFDLIQAGKIDNIQKQVQIAAIFNYGIGQYKYGDKQTGIKAFNLIEKTFDQSKPNNLLLALNVCSSYSLVEDLIQRGNNVLDRFQKVFQQKKDNQDFRDIYESSLFYRIKIYFNYQRYQKLYDNLNIAFDKFQQFIPNQTKFFYFLLKFLSQLKLGKRQDAQNSIQKTLKAIQQYEPQFPKNICKELLADVELVERKMKEQLSSDDKQILDRIKELIMKSIKNN